MPLLNDRGDVYMGVGDGPGSVNGTVIATPGGGGAWLDPHTVITQIKQDGRYMLATFDRLTATPVRVSEIGANNLFAGGGRWVAWLAGTGMFGALTDRLAMPRAVGPDGTIAVTRRQQEGLGFVLVPPGCTLDSPNLTEAKGAVAYDVQVLSATEAIYTSDARYVVGVNVTAPRCIGKVYRPKRVMLNGEPWIVYWSESAGLVAHRWNDPTRAVVIETKPEAFNHDAIANINLIRVAYSRRQGELPEDLVVRDVFPEQATTDLTAGATVPPVFAPFDAPRWVGYIYATSDRFGDNPAAPGNCEVIVEPGVAARARRPVIVKLDSLDRTPEVWARTLAIWVSATTVADLEAQAEAVRATGKPGLYYLDGPKWDRALRVPGIAGIQVYCHANETLEQCRDRARAQMNASGATQIALICQSYDQNADLTLDIVPLQAMFVELARDPRVKIGPIWFSDGRALPDGSRGGARVHPELRPWHQATVNAMRGTPPFPTTGVSMIVPKVTIQSYGPKDGIAPLRCQAIARQEEGSGPVDRYIWLYRSVGATSWLQAADNSATDIDHTYVLPAGRWEIALQGKGPGGTAQTQIQRIVTARPPAPPPAPPTPEPPSPPVSDEVPLPTYKQLLEVEGPQIDRVIGRVSPAFGLDVALHTAWRRLNENWSHENILRDLRREPLQGLVQRQRVTDLTYRPGWMQDEGQALINAIRGTGRLVTPADMRHNAWRRFVERWTLSNMLHDIKGEPLDVPPPPPEPTGPDTSVRVRPDGRIFRRGDTPWRYKGVTAFPLPNRYAQGQDIDPFLRAYRGFNVLRAWPYVPSPPWNPGWDVSPHQVYADFVRDVGRKGFDVEITLLTDDNPARIPWARSLVEYLAGQNLTNLFVEIGNEPTTNGKKIETDKLKDTLNAAGFVYASGNYEDSNLVFGKYGVAHTGRDNEWQRRAHDLMEYFNGGGPNDPSDPAHRMPWVADEPIRPDQAGFNAVNFRAYYGACALLGAGATIHTNSGKDGQPPTAQEAPCVAAALQGLDAFSADAPLGPYNRPVENSLRTYVVGNNMVRIPPCSPDPPVPGLTRMDPEGILWRW